MLLLLIITWHVQPQSLRTSYEVLGEITYVLEIDIGFMGQAKLAQRYGFFYFCLLYCLSRLNNSRTTTIVKVRYLTYYQGWNFRHVLIMYNLKEWQVKTNVNPLANSWQYRVIVNVSGAFIVRIFLMWAFHRHVYSSFFFSWSLTR